MKLIHTSDWHLGAKLHEKDRSDEHRLFLKFLIELLRRERPDALLVSGDIFDVRMPSSEAQTLYYRFLATAVKEQLCGQIVVTAGNHDSARLLAAPDRLLNLLRVTVVARAGQDPANEVVTLRRPDGSPALAIAAVPFLSDGELMDFARDAGETEGEPARLRALGFRAHYANVLAEAHDQAKGAPVVAMGHCTVLGSRLSDSRSERAQQVGGLDQRALDAFEGADYVALGHLHIPQPLAGGRVRYSGSPLAMSFSEAEQQKILCMVELGEKAGAPVAVTEIPVPEWTPLRVLKGCPAEIRDGLDALVEAAGAKAVYVAAHVTQGEGEDLKALGDTLRKQTEDSGVQVLAVRDERPLPEGAGLQDWTENATELTALKPEEVARRFLEEKRLSEELLDHYMALFDDVIATLEGDAQ